MKTYNVEILIAIPIVLVVLVVPALLLIGCFGSKNSQRKRQKFRDPAESSGNDFENLENDGLSTGGPYMSRGGGIFLLWPGHPVFIKKFSDK